MKIKISKKLKELTKIICRTSKLYIVGGYVRDSLLKKQNNDIDLTSNLKVEELEKLLFNTNFYLIEKNLQFGTAKIKNKSDEKVSFDYTCFRFDSYTSGKHSPKKVEFVKTLEDDAHRRDFTINAIYYDIQSKKLIDPFNALVDLKNKQIREIHSETLKYDGERLLRLIKYASILNFNIEEKTFLNAVSYKDNLKALSDKTLQKFITSVESLSMETKNNIKSHLKLLNFDELTNKF